MVLGTGTDILKIQRIRIALKTDDRGSFVRKTFTPEERRQAEERSDPALYYATRFAGKEAVFKCFGVESGSLRLNDIEIIASETGQPKVNLYGDFARLASEKGIRRIEISLSYEDEYAIAFAVAESEIKP